MVTLRRDEDDLGALFVFDEDGAFIDTAVNHARRGLTEKAFAEEARRQQAEWMKAQRAELREKKRRYSIEDAAASLLRQDAERAGRLVTLPPRTIDRTTPQLASIAAAPSAPETQPTFDDAVIRLSARKERSIVPAEKVAAADRIIAAAEAGAEVDQAELARARLYAGTSEYRAEKLISASFGAQPHNRRQSA
jgi:hypothetical protein